MNPTQHFNLYRGFKNEKQINTTEVIKNDFKFMYMYFEITIKARGRLQTFFYKNDLANMKLKYS